MYYSPIDLMKSMFEVSFSAEGSNRAKEEQAYIYFGDFMDKCEGDVASSSGR